MSGHLFDPTTTEQPKCPSCGTTDPSLCDHDTDIHAGVRDPYARRPKGCLNAYEPATARIPY